MGYDAQYDALSEAREKESEALNARMDAALVLCQNCGATHLLFRAQAVIQVIQASMMLKNPNKV